VEEAVERLRNGAAHAATHRARTDDPPVAFLFPGQGAQYVDAARDLYGREDVFTTEVDRCAALLRTELGRDLRELLFPPAAEAARAAEELTHTAWTQPALFVLEYALARQWMQWGVHPRALIGHSVGEYVAACLAGVFDLDD